MKNFNRLALKYTFFLVEQLKRGKKEKKKKMVIQRNASNRNIESSIVSAEKSGSLLLILDMKSRP